MISRIQTFAMPRSSPRPSGLNITRLRDTAQHVHSRRSSMMKRASRLLERTLEEEKEADQKLTGLTEEINVNATKGKSVAGEKPEKPRETGTA
jgi:hypothetical protein